MGSAVPSDCQKRWTSTTAARGHVASFIHEASPPAPAGEEGEAFCEPSWEHRHPRDTTCTFHFLESAVICLHPYWNSSLFHREVIWLFPARQALFKRGKSEGRRGSSSSLLSDPTLALILMSRSSVKMTLAAVVFLFQRSVLDSKWICWKCKADG